MSSAPPPIDDLKRETLIETAKLSSEISNDLMKWTLGSLLLVNGGALVALIGIEDIREGVFNSAGWLFASGMLTALLGGMSLAVGVGLSSRDNVVRAWDPRPITEVDPFSFKSSRSTEIFVGAGFFLWVASLLLFVLGSFDASMLPGQAADEKVLSEAHDANIRASIATQELTEVAADKGATKEELRDALKRARAAGAEATIAVERMNEHFEGRFVSENKSD